MTLSLKEAFALKEAIAVKETNPHSEGIASSPKIKKTLGRVSSENLSFEDARYELLDRIKDKAASGILLPRVESSLPQKIGR
ncbi:MAG: hypothetical protein KBH12_02760 [Synergistaceae bacterium]|nr:hypothetical protein [Synergistaceae bacterium]MBP9626795.1 hypothetical protein [Synergistaceae bacterium]MBP9957692.1 hypothetical protein [Synergistaceae bacterium]